MSTGAHITGDFFHFHSPLYYQPKNFYIFDQYNDGQKLVKITERLRKMKKMGFSFVNLEILQAYPIFSGGRG